MNKTHSTHPNRATRPALALAFAALGALATTLTAADTTMEKLPPTASKITAATVYTDRAIVTRTAHVELPLGETLVTLEKLPTTLVDASVQVTGRGTAAATILDVSTRVTYTQNDAEVDQPRIKELQDQIKLVEQELIKINGRETVLKQQGALLDQIEATITAPPSSDSKAPRATLEEMQKLMTFSLESRTKHAADSQAIASDRTTAQQKLNTLRSQLNVISSTARNSGKSYKTVTVRVSAAQAGTLDLNVAYTVGTASWSPAYDVRMRTDERAIEMTYYGVVRQTSGEDWNNIALTLSTARPSLGSAAPTLNPWYLDIFVPQPVVNFQRARKDVSMDMAKMSQSFNVAAEMAAPAPMAMAIAADEDRDATIATATVDSTVSSATFKIAAASTITSDNTSQKVSITTVKLPAKLQYQSTPSMQETAFLSAYVTNGTDFPFLAGPTNIFLDNAFVSTSTLKSVMPTEKFEVSLGADEGVAVKRRIVNRFAENTGITGKGRRVTYEYLVTITNNKKTAERVVFKEALPLSRNEKIVVKLIAPNEKEIGTLEKPGKEVTREEDNKLVWRLDLKPGEKREIPVKFSVDYPGDIQVSDLE